MKKLTSILLLFLFSSTVLSNTPLAIQPNSLDIFCDKVNIDCSDPETQKWYKAYYTLPWQKAMAIAYPKGNILGGLSGAYFWYGEESLNFAKARAMGKCNLTKEVASDKCSLLLVNHIIVNQDYINLLNMKIPSNAYASGSSWKCNSGYKKSGNNCNKIYVPANASLSGTSWKCNYGYTKIGTRCQVVPENATATSSGWKCNIGFSKDGMSCNKIEESKGYITELKNIKELLDSGIINEEDFEKMKQKIIDNM